jgi:acetoacetyl-CoA synthetase
VVHEVTGDVIGYRKTVAGLGADRPVYGLQSPVLDGTVPVQHRIEDMAAAYIAEIRELHPDGPYRLLGSCFGGVVAYEMARQLTGAGHVVDFVAMINAVPFGYVNDERRAPTPRLRSIGDVRRRLRSVAVRSRRRLHRQLWWRGARGYVQSGRPLPPHLAEPITLHHVASHAYVAKPYAGRVITVVTDSVGVTPYDRRLLWDDLTDEVEMIELLGPEYVRAHFVTSPGALEAGHRLREILDRLDGGTP